MGIVGGILYAVHHALQRAPDFYQTAVAIPVAQQQEAGHQFERTVLALHNDIVQGGQWQHVFSADQINGWLAVDLPRKFPSLLPSTVRDPRIALVPQQLRVAFRFEGEQLSAVISLCVEVELAEEPNTLAIRICQAQAGWVPIPLKDFLDQISQAAQRSNVMLRWARREGDPVALITIPSETDLNDGKQFILDVIEIREDELVLGGHTDATAARSRGAGKTPPGQF